MVEHEHDLSMMGRGWSITVDAKLVARIRRTVGAFYRNRIRIAMQAAMDDLARK